MEIDDRGPPIAQSHTWTWHKISQNRAKMSTNQSDGKTSIEEVQWTDDSIRWEGGLRVKPSADDESDKGDSSDDEDYVVDPFK